MAHVLIASATWDYPYLGEEHARPQLEDVLKRVVNLFTGTLKCYRRELESIGRNPHSDTFLKTLDKWFAAAERDPSDSIVLYYTGHAELGSESGPLYLLTGNTKPELFPSTAFTFSKLVELVTAQRGDRKVRRVRNLLILLDACCAGAGAVEVASRFADELKRKTGASFYFLGAALPRQEAQAGAFATAMIASIEELSKRYVRQEFLFFDQIVPEINRRLRIQQVIYLVMGSPMTVPEFFPNPSFVPTDGTDVVANEAQRAISDQEFREHWGPRSRGVEFDNQPGFYFFGREAVLDQLSGFLNGEGDSQTRVLVGRPGSGKSAILARILTLSRPELAAQVCPAGKPIRPLDLAVHAKGKSLKNMSHLFARVLNVPPQPEAIVRCLRGRDSPFRLLVDALDEAAEATEIAAQLLRPLNNIPSVKLIVGSREELLPTLEGAKLIDIDRDDGVRNDIAKYVNARLLRIAEPGASTPYAGQEAVAERVAEAVANKANPVFLIARLVVEDLLARSGAVNPDARHEMSFPSKVTSAFDAYLARFGSKEVMVRDILRPLAYSEGLGLPWDNIWAPLASALAGRQYGGPELRWVLEHAGAFILEGTEHGRSVFRLYHQALADTLRKGMSSRSVEAEFVRVLGDGVPRRILGGGKDWRLASRYACAYVAAHAARAGFRTLEALFQDVEYVSCAEPASLLRVIPQLRSASARARGEVYRLCAGNLTPDRADNLSLLELVSHIQGVREFAEVISKISDLPYHTCWARMSPQRSQLRMLGHRGKVTAVAMKKLDDQPVVVSGGSDGTVRIWDARSGTTRVEPLRGHLGEVASVTLGELDGQPVIVSGGADGTVRMWDARSGTARLKPLRGYQSGRAWKTLGEVDGQRVVVAGDDDGVLRVRDTRSGALRGYAEQGSRGTLASMAEGDLDGQHVVVTGDADGTVRIYHDALSCSAHYDERHRDSAGSLTSVALGKLDGQRVVVTGDRDGTVQVWDACSGTTRAGPLRGHLGEVASVALGELDGQPVIVSGGADGTVRMWDARSGAARVESLRKHESWVTSVAMGEFDGKPVIVSGGADGTVRVWNARSGTASVESLRKDVGWVCSVALGDFDGEDAIVAGSISGTVWTARPGTPRRKRLFNAEGSAPSGAPRFKRLFEQKGVTSVALGELDGQPVIVSGSGDGTIRVSDARSGTARVELLRKHEGGVTSLAMKKLDGQPVIVSGGNDGTVRVWNARSGAAQRVPFLDRPLACAFDSEGVIAIAGSNGLVLIRLSSAN